MTDDDVTLGEVWRAVRRLEISVQQMTVALGPIGEFRVRLENVEKDIDELAVAGRENTARLDKIEIRAASVAGGVAALAFLLKFLFWK